MKVRSFAIEDYEAVRRIWVASGLDIRPGDELQGVISKLTRDPELFLVAEDNKKIVGTVMGAWDGRRGWIYHLGVDPSAQRRGVASRMIKELEARMKSLNIPKVNALIYPWNDASVSFFASAGYQVEDMKEAQKWLGPAPRPKRQKKSGLA
jgi:ribosomal protein S18 acetylase RimI-like enzyme